MTVKSVLTVLLWSAVSLAQPLTVGATLASDAPAHVVRKGDTLSAVGRKHGLSVARLKELNGLRSDRIKPGMRLILNLPVKPPADSVVELPATGLRSVIESYLGTPYRFGGSSQNGIDCSAFVQKVFLELDIALPRSAREQFDYGEEIDQSELHSGDLLFFRTYAEYPSHVGIYLGDGKMVHASARSRRVVASDIDLPYYRKRFLGARRFTAQASSMYGLTALEAEFEEPFAEDDEFVGQEELSTPDAGGEER